MTHLLLYHGRDSEKMSRRLREANERQEKISSIEIRETVLADELIDAIVDVLIQETVDSVQLDSCGAYLNRNAINMAKALGNVKCLRLSEPTFLSQYFLDCLLDSAETLQNLRIQDYLSVSQIKALSKGLASNSSLKILDLSRSRLEDISFLSIGVGQNSSLRCLRLRSLNISDGDLGELLSSLSDNSSLKELDLSFNRMRDMPNICSLLRESQYLEHLYLGYQNVWQAPKISFAEFASALAENTSLKTLSLAKNKLDDSDAEELCEALRRNQTIENLDLRENRFTDNGLLLIFRVLSKHKSIRRVNLSKIYISGHVMEVLLKVIMETLNLVHVEVDGDCTTAEKIRYFASLNKGGRRLLFENPSIGIWPHAIQRINLMEWQLDDSTSQFDDHMEESQKLDAIFFLLKGPAIYEGMVCK
jgi:Ran GTPase-activating protein (RanGAP) involved in mRNA processing and transport